MKVLMDDTYIAMHGFDHAHGHMYSCSRQTTQGSQWAYVNSPTDIGGDAKDSESDLEYELSDTLDHAYLSRAVTQTMREITH